MLIRIFGVEESIPMRSLASVPELPKFNFEFFLIDRDPIPFPKIL